MANPRVVQTVRGPIDPESLGITSMHEHLWMDASPLLAVHGYERGGACPWDASVAAEARWNPGVHADNYRLTDVNAPVEDLAPFRAAGGATIVELTPPALGRKVDRVRDIAEQAGVHVVQGTGHYLGVTNEAWVVDANEATITARLVADAVEVIDGTRIRAGIYGEIGTADPVTAAETRVLTAVAAASRETGLAIPVHLQAWGHEGARVLQTIAAAGAAIERVVLSHLNTAIDRPDESVGLRPATRS